MPLSLWQSVVRGCAVALSILGVLGHASTVEPIAADDLAAAEAGSFVQQALEAEFLADAARREQHLAAALAIDPAHERANWLSGRVNLGGKWLSLAEAYTEAQSDADEQYRQKRERLDGSPQKEQQLARWCVAQGQSDRARLHFARVLMNPASNAEVTREAMKALDLQLYRGQYLTEDEVLLEEKQALAVKEAFRNWQPKLAEWQRTIDAAGAANAKVKAAAAREEMDKISDEAIIPVLEAQIPTASEPMSLEIVAVLSKFSEKQATEALCRMSVFSSHEKAQTAAISELKKRKLYDYVPFLLGALNPVTKSQFQIQHGADGSVGYVHQVYQDGPLANRVGTVARFAVAQNIHTKAIVRRRRPYEPRQREPLVVPTFDTNLDAEYVAMARIAAANTEHHVAQANAAAKSLNLPVFNALEQATGQQLDRDPGKWWTWWRKHNELDSAPTHYEFNQRATRFFKSYYQTERLTSCFAAGTLVATDSGPRTIESISIGDHVLSRDPETGELAFKLVLQKTLRPATDVAKVTIGDDAIVASLGHPFWVNREGWRMTKELAAGDYLHTLAGGRLVQGAQNLNLQLPVHNLVVDGFHTYFVGENGVMVHDNTYREPTLALVPGLVLAEAK